MSTGARERRAWVETTLRELVLGAPENTLRDRGGVAIFGPPLVGVADGDDPLFETFRDVVSPRHLMPRAVIRDRMADPSAPVRVIAWALPYTEAVRRSNRGAEWPSSLYSQARNNAAALSERVSRSFVARLVERGHAATTPIATAAYDAFRDERWVFSSAWSERHAAYAAGLGTFGLNAGLITPAGIAVRFGSAVTDLDVEVSASPTGSHRHPCLGPDGTGCGRCIPRCPAGAIGPDGLDKEKCYQRRNVVRERFLPGYRQTLELLEADVVKGGKRTSGHSLGCALCQCGVPCEAGTPQTAAGGGHAGA
ncbi:MAG TPA: epoxyqueuosine reductase [bacterium]